MLFDHPEASFLEEFNSITSLIETSSTLFNGMWIFTTTRHKHFGVMDFYTIIRGQGMSKIPTDLNRSLNMHISKICPFTLGTNDSENHCAHYVCHMMGYQFPGTTCKNMTWAEKKTVPRGATIRVNDLFNTLKMTGSLSAKPNTLTECLIFVTLSSNIQQSGGSLRMGSQRKKHVGILTQGKVWNYSNSNNKVAADSLNLFESKFSSTYKAPNSSVEFYYGEFL